MAKILSAWKPRFIHSDRSKKLDFVNLADERRFDEETVVKLFGPPPPDAMLVFGSPDESGSAKPV